MVEFPFETVSKNGVDWDVTMKVTMDDGDHFMRKFLEIEVSDKEKAAIDYIDLESLNDAFHEMGGRLSFALCMLDKVNNGYIINVMHSNNGCFAYIKEVVDGKSYIELGDEENQALQQAVAGRMGDADLGRKVNDAIQKDVSVD